MKQDYINRIKKMEIEYQKAGAGGAFNAGMESGKLLVDVAGLLTGVAGAGKGGAVLTQKLTGKLGIIDKPITTTTTGNKPATGTTGISTTETVKPSVITEQNKPLGLGSTGRDKPANLKEKLALEQAISNPNGGVVLPLPMSDKRWPASQGWVKMSQNINGIESHFSCCL